MADVLEMAPLGIRIEFLKSAEQTGGESLEMEVSGRTRGFLAQRHVHPSQVERLEVISGVLKVAMDGREHVLHRGESIEVPAGTPHTQVPLGHGDGVIRIQVRPAGRTQAFLERLAELSAEGKLTRRGFPRPLAAAELVLDYADAGYAAGPPLAAQQRLARLIRRSQRPYLFIDEWDVSAPPEAVFAALADARTYPTWWQEVYLDVDGDDDPAVGGFKGRLPYHLHTRSVISELDPPRTVTADVDGDLRGRGVWTVTPTSQGSHVRFDWQVHADRKLLRVLTPVLRPLLRANHNWAIARAREGLEPYARRTAVQPAAKTLA